MMSSMRSWAATSRLLGWAHLIVGCSGADDAPASEFDDAVAAKSALCEQLAACYPEPEFTSRCGGPADPPRSRIIFGDPIPPSAAAKQCVLALEDHASIASYLSCVTKAYKDALSCLATCPATLNACAIPSNDALLACSDRHPGAYNLLDDCGAPLG